MCVVTVRTAVVLVSVAVLMSACTRDQSQPGAAATSTPAVRVAPTPAPQAQAPAEAEEPIEELYVDLEGDPDEGAPPLTVKWTSTVEDGTAPFTYKWEFGDGTPPSTDANPTHVYQKEGEYTATLTVTDSKGLKGSEEYDILVEAEQ
jgi:PKD repeat protein